MSSAATPLDRIERRPYIAAIACLAEQYGLIESEVRTLASPIAVEQRHVAGIALGRRQRRRAPRPRGLAEDQPAAHPARAPAPDATARHDERERHGVRGAIGRQIEQPRGHGGRRDGRREVGRPDAAIENFRPADGAAEAAHHLVAHRERGGELPRVDVADPCRHGQRDRHHHRARRRPRWQMDVVDFGEARHRRPDRDIVDGTRREDAGPSVAASLRPAIW